MIKKHVMVSAHIQQTLKFYIISLAYSTPFTIIAKFGYYYFPSKKSTNKLLIIMMIVVVVFQTSGSKLGVSL